MPLFDTAFRGLTASEGCKHVTTFRITANFRIGNIDVED
jgi:hypothetical protein